ncbi:hypothetical protein ABZ642_26490 [Streptomyces sp. NPDC007157]|uniref:hypothetical protein n=1 Tax=Streptomyces sp. NPDC007157 TaxID=3154681 RepID=UPI0033E63F27
MTAGWCARTVRAAVFAAVCVLLAALGHVMMSGSRVPGWALAAGLVVTGVLGWALAGRERGLPLVVSAAVGAQTALHGGFSAAQAWTSQLDPMASMDMAPMDMASTHMASTHMASTHMASMDMAPAHMGPVHMGPMHMDMAGHMASTHMGPAHLDPVEYLGFGTGGTASTGMLAAHLLAALLCGLWLGHGERAAFRILRAVAGRLTAPLRLLLALPAAPERPRPRPLRRRSDRAPRLLLLVHAITSRGPPVRTAVA